MPLDSPDRLRFNLRLNAVEKEQDGLPGAVAVIVIFAGLACFWYSFQSYPAHHAGWGYLLGWILLIAGCNVRRTKKDREQQLERVLREELEAWFDKTNSQRINKQMTSISSPYVKNAVTRIYCSARGAASKPEANQAEIFNSGYLIAVNHCSVDLHCDFRKRRTPLTPEESELYFAGVERVLPFVDRNRISIRQIGSTKSYILERGKSAQQTEAAAKVQTPNNLNRIATSKTRVATETLQPSPSSSIALNFKPPQALGHSENSRTSSSDKGPSRELAFNPENLPEALEMILERQSDRSLVPSMVDAKLATEKVAMEIAKEYEQECGFTVEDVSASNIGYDLHSKRGDEERRIEVKD